METEKQRSDKEFLLQLEELLACVNEARVLLRKVDMGVDEDEVAFAALLAEQVMQSSKAN